MPGISVKKRDGESPNSLLYRFSKKVQHSGVLREAKKRRFHKRKVNKTSRRVSALHREEKRVEKIKARKMGIN